MVKIAELISGDRISVQKVGSLYAGGSLSFLDRYGYLSGEEKSGGCEVWLCYDETILTGMSRLLEALDENNARQKKSVLPYRRYLVSPRTADRYLKGILEYDSCREA